MRALYFLLAVMGLCLPTLATAQIPLEALRSCQEIEDQTKERLDCYDDKVKPDPKPVSGPVKKVEDCRFLKEEDERLNCFNRFVGASPKNNTAPQKAKKSTAGAKASGPAKQ